MANSNSLLVATIAFWSLVSLTVLLPARWSLLSFLLLIQFDLSAAGSYSSTASLGIDNAIKTVVVPSLLLLRMRPIQPIAPIFSKMCRYWLLFCAYASVAVLWSPFRLSAVKMLGYLYCYCVLFLVFTTAWRRRWISVNGLTLIVWVSLFLGYVQTYLLGNIYGEPDYGRRFTSFTGAQSFAPFLLVLIVVLMFRKHRNLMTLLTAGAASIGIILTGSRSTFLGMAWVLMVGGIISAVRSGKKVSFRMILKRVGIGFAGIACVGLFVIVNLPKDRLNEMLSAVISQNDTLEDVGTFAWRYSLYQKTFDDLETRSLPNLLVGSGTSSGANLVLANGFFQEEDVDPNRSLHDEFLRAAYEWGLPGLLFLGLFLAEAISVCYSLIVRYHSWQAGAFAAILVPLMLSLAVENILAESSAPVGVGYCLVLAGMVASWSGGGGRSLQAGKPSTITRTAIARDTA